MSRNETDRWNKCESKKPWKGPDGESQAWGAARLIMRNELRMGIVHRMTVYECKYSEGPDTPHYHVGTRQKPFVVGTYMSRTTREWAEYMQIKWTDADEAEARQWLSAWESGIDILQKYRDMRRGGPKWSPKIEADKKARARSFGTRSARRSRYGGTT